MESLLKLSGLLGDEDDDRTDLGTLEKRLADKNLNQSHGGTPTRETDYAGSQPRVFDSTQNTPPVIKLPTPQKSTFASPKEPSKEAPKDKDQPVEELSDMMCSLLTNNCGETRYIGKIAYAVDLY